MNVRRAFQKNNIANPLFVAANGVEALEQLRDGDDPARAPHRAARPQHAADERHRVPARAARATPSCTRTPVVVLTTSNDERDKIEAYNLNVAGYLLKPVTFIELLRGDGDAEQVLDARGDAVSA